ncbi:cation:proton antiporter, partial [Candidatus Microgenomates bacterium]|nr:cation:proton antiporter [Candidatus Microgenomates bacterium]
MDALSLVSSLVAVFLVAFIGAFFAKKFKQPILTGYLISGLLATTILGCFFNFSNAKVLADLGLAFLMFVIGLEFSFRRLNRVKKIAVFGAVVQMILTTAVLLPITGNFIVAMVFSLSSTAIVVKLLTERGELDTLPSEIIVGWLLIQDLAVVPILTIMPAVIAGGNLSSIATSVVISLIKAGVLLYLVLVIGKRFVPKILTKVAEMGSREILLIAIVGLVLFSAGVTNYFGLSFALGAFLAGLLIAESASQHSVFSEIRPLRDVFAVVFFVTLGVLLSPEYVFANWLTVIKLTAVVILVKLIISTGITVFFKYHLKTALQVGLSLTQVGEFAFVVAQLGLSGGLISQDIYSQILAVTILTMILTPWQLKLSVGIYEKMRDFTIKWSPKIYNSVFAGFDRYKKDHEAIELSNHVVICGHGRVGKHITRILAMADI